jgi:ribonuclease P protein component
LSERDGTAFAPAWKRWAAAASLPTGGERGASVSPPDTLLRATTSRLKQRAEYLRVAGTRRRYAAPGVVVQLYRRPAGTSDADEIRYGITASRRVGNAVVRNRVRRRLRAAAEQVLPAMAAQGCDYVLVGRQATAKRPFGDLIGDLKTALRRLRACRHPPVVDGGETARGVQRQ